MGKSYCHFQDPEYYIEEGKLNPKTDTSGWLDHWIEQSKLF